jgi:hypothetical protein
MERREELEAALAEVAELAAAARDRWWIIGSAAAVLHGAVGIQVRDVDLLMSRHDAAKLLRAGGIAPAPGPADPLFRSQVFGRFSAAGHAVEVMGGFSVRSGDVWRPVRLRGRLAVNVAGAAVFVPTKAELIALLRSFGRDKDLERAERLVS